MNVCRIIKDFPSIHVLRKPSSKGYGKVDYTQYGLAPGVYSLMVEQVRLGASIDVIAARSKKTPRHEAAGGIEVHRVGKPYEIMAMEEMRKLNTERNFDIVHTHATSGIFYVFLKRFMKEKKPLVGHVHGTTAGVLHALKPLPTYGIKQAFKERFWSWVSLERQKIMWSKAERLLCVSSNIAKELTHFYGISDEKIKVVYNGVDVEYFKPATENERLEARKRLGIEDDKPWLLCVGHLSPRKGIGFLLEAAPSVLENFPKATFAFLGGMPKFVKRTDYMQIWLGLAVKSKIRRNILFLGEVGHKETLTYYHAADVFVFPTLYEGLAKALLEAMACQLPIVATNVGGNRDAITNRQNGLFVKPYCSKELATAIIEVLSNQSFAKCIGENARQTVCRNFTWKKVAEKTHTVYKEVLRD